MKPVGSSLSLVAAPKQVVTSFRPPTIRAITTIEEELFALVAMAGSIADEIKEAQKEVSQLLRTPNSAKDAIEEAEKEVTQLLQKQHLNIRRIAQVQGEVAQLLQDQLQAAQWTVFVLGDEVELGYVGEKNSQPQPPMRELLLLVAVNACSPATIIWRWAF